MEVMQAPSPAERAARIEEFLEENVRVGDLLLYFLVCGRAGFFGFCFVLFLWHFF